MQKKKKKWIIPVVIIGVIVVIFICLIMYGKKKAEEMLSQMTSTETAFVERRDLASSVSATGKVVSQESHTVKSVLSGVVITEIPVEVGDQVKEGDLICTFDTRKMENTLESAQNTKEETGITNSYNQISAAEELRDAQDAYNRKLTELQMTVDLKQRDYETAANDLEKAKTDYLSDETPEKADVYNQAYTKAATAYAAYQESLNNLETQKVELLEAIEKAQYDLQLSNVKSGNDTTGTAVQDAAIDIENATVTAPVGGTVTSVSVAKGDTYGGGAIVTIEDEKNIEIAAQIDEYDIAKIKEGQKAVIRTNATGDTEFSGRVEKVAPKATTATSSSGSVSSSSSQDVTYEVRISLDEKSADLKLDMTAKVSIITEEKKNVLTVPYDAVQTDDEGNDYVEAVIGPKKADTEEPGTEETGTEEPETEKPSGERPDPKQGFPPGKGDLPNNIPSATIPGLSDTKRIPVKRGIESAYYIEVISDELSEGMEVIVPQSSDSLSDIMQIMGQRGPMGGM